MQLYFRYSFLFRQNNQFCLRPVFWTFFLPILTFPIGPGPRDGSYNMSYDSVHVYSIPLNSVEVGKDMNNTLACTGKRKRRRRERKRRKEMSREGEGEEGERESRKRMSIFLFQTCTFFYVILTNFFVASLGVKKREASVANLTKLCGCGLRLDQGASFYSGQNAIVNTNSITAAQLKNLAFRPANDSEGEFCFMIHAISTEKNVRGVGRLFLPIVGIF